MKIAWEETPNKITLVRKEHWFILWLPVAGATICFLALARIIVTQPWQVAFACDRSPQNLVNCQLVESFLLRPEPKKTAIANLKSIDYGGKNEDIQLITDSQRFLLKSSFIFDYSPDSKKQTCRQLGQFLINKNWKSLELKTLYFTQDKTLPIALLLFLVLFAIGSRFSIAQTTYIFDRIDRQVTISQISLLGFITVDKFAFTDIAGIEIQELTKRDKTQIFLIYLNLTASASRNNFPLRVQGIYFPITKRDRYLLTYTYSYANPGARREAEAMRDRLLSFTN